MNLFCPSIGCHNLALFGAESVGYWCRPCWDAMQALLAQKLAGGTMLDPHQWAIYCMGCEQAIARRQEQAAAAATIAALPPGQHLLIEAMRRQAQEREG